MRKKQVTYPIIKSIYPILFWRKCSFCEYKFLLEKGFEIEALKAIQSNRSSPTHIYYCCNKCASDVHDVKEIIKKNKTAKRPPSAPANYKRII